ncbi:fumarylacetoacetate hydrolase family protein [Robiginitalea sp. SC105]|uniref:fumarylacetoacetate hydrolase family protein n=1 Tax=Robiginitalea sp. SC105 TaxID=2762332 RepID=UPI00163B4C22|nr:fumarylacetoacetate hydrolase family protein [Robiginitalea sp. SC105]MBC2838705.1 fumarylacetoacetate hydrolase family protein [Robiginitalea sp. SC105]
MKLFKTTQGTVIGYREAFYRTGADWDELVCDAQPRQRALDWIGRSGETADPLGDLGKLLPPIGRQEVWASGVTYLRSRSARMEESRDAGGGTFYDRVYEAERPELFFKAAPYRVVGHGGQVRIRKDSAWNVPEPELTLLLSPKGTITGYTIGNDMSSRSIEGENPLYLPQAKSYNGSTALGPCIYLPEEPLPAETEIQIAIFRQGKEAFGGQVPISQIKRQFDELASWLYRELSFPYGCLLMTGTGIVPPNEFTLRAGDEIRITIPPVGTLVNTVAPA